MAGRSLSKIARAAGVAFGIAAMWVWFVGSANLHEMLVGVAVTGLVSLFVLTTSEPGHPPIELRAADLMQLWRIPWYIVSGIAEISSLLLKDLAGKRAGSYYRYCGFLSSRENPVELGRTVLATAYTSTAPNFIVIGVDSDQNRMIFHQIQRSTVPKMTQNLGAQ